MSRNTSDNRASGRRGAVKALAAGGFTTALVVGSVVGTAGVSNAANGWGAVAQCESGGNAHIATGNGYYGLYQFDRQTWQGLGYSGTANQHSAAVQTQAAEKLYAQRGASPWPVCGKRLSGSASVSSSSARASRSSARKAVSTYKRPATVTYKRQVTRSAVRTHVAAPVRVRTHQSSASTHSYVARTHTELLGTWLISQRRTDVASIQAKLNSKGAKLSIDGRFGPLTKAALMSFQKSAHILVDGVYGSQCKAALFG